MRGQSNAPPPSSSPSLTLVCPHRPCSRPRPTTATSSTRRTAPPATPSSARKSVPPTRAPASRPPCASSSTRPTPSRPRPTRLRYGIASRATSPPSFSRRAKLTPATGSCSRTPRRSRRSCSCVPALFFYSCVSARARLTLLMSLFRSSGSSTRRSVSPSRRPPPPPRRSSPFPRLPHPPRHPPRPTARAVALRQPSRRRRGRSMPSRSSTRPSRATPIQPGASLFRLVLFTPNSTDSLSPSFLVQHPLHASQERACRLPSLGARACRQAAAGQHARLPAVEAALWRPRSRIPRAHLVVSPSVPFRSLSLSLSLSLFAVTPASIPHLACLPRRSSSLFSLSRNSHICIARTLSPRSTYRPRDAK